MAKELGSRTQSKAELPVEESPKEAEPAQPSRPAYVIEADAVQAAWDAVDPNALVRELLCAWLERESERRGEDLQQWDENENRFQQNELTWLANFTLHNLGLCKRLGLADAPAAQLTDLLWCALDLFGEEAPLQAAMARRYALLQGGLREMFEAGALSKAQVAETLQFARITLFGHLQLYLACVQMKKQKTVVKKIGIFQETPRLHESKGLEQDCQEIQTASAEDHKEVKEEEAVVEEEAAEEEEP